MRLRDDNCIQTMRRFDTLANFQIVVLAFQAVIELGDVALHVVDELILGCTPAGGVYVPRECVGLTFVLF